MDHIGYDLEGVKVARPKGEDAIDRFVALNETSSGWKSVYDEKTGKRVIISDRDMEYIKRLQKGASSDRYDAENVRTIFAIDLLVFMSEKVGSLTETT
jgi:ribosome biogenesis protein ERB1